MSGRPEQFLQRRLILQRQCARQREQLAQTSAELGATLKFANRGLSLARGARAMPMILAAASAAGILSRAGGVIRLLGRAWLVVSTLQRLRRSLR